MWHSLNLMWHSRRYLFLYLNPYQHPAHRREAAAVDGAGAEFFQRGEVAGGTVAFVAGKVVAGKVVIHGAHLGIARDLGENRGGGNRGYGFVPFKVSRRAMASVTGSLCAAIADGSASR